VKLIRKKQRTRSFIPQLRPPGPWASVSSNIYIKWTITRLHVSNTLSLSRKCSVTSTCCCPYHTTYLDHRNNLIPTKKKKITWNTWPNKSRKSHNSMYDWVYSMQISINNDTQLKIGARTRNRIDSFNNWKRKLRIENSNNNWFHNSLVEWQIEVEKINERNKNFIVVHQNDELLLAVSN